MLPAFVAGVFALSFNYGAYMTEIFRAGIQAIPRGQVEAAAALGMTERSTMRRIVLPQAIRIVIPAIGNEFIAMIKDSALVVVRRPSRRSSGARAPSGTGQFQSFATLMLAALIYWVLTIVFSLVQERLEKRMARATCGYESTVRRDPSADPSTTRSPDPARLTPAEAPSPIVARPRPAEVLRRPTTCCAA